MLIEQLTKAWREREADTPLETCIALTDEGLILGAGTRLTAGRETCRAEGSALEAPRLEALLTIAYARPLARTARGHLRRALACWADGDDALAAMHLAHADLGRLPEPREAARKLFMAEQLMVHGLTPEDVLRAYNPEQPRVDAGNGIQSGRWTAGFAPAGGQPTPHATPAERTPLDPAAGAAERAAAQAGERAGVEAAAAAAQRTSEEIAARVAGGVVARIASALIGPLGEAASLLPAAAVFGGVLLIPAPNPTADWHDVPGTPGLRYRRSLWTLQLQIQYRDSSGREQTSGLYANGRGVLLDAHGHPVGHTLPGGSIALDLNLVSPGAVDPRGRELCPVPTPDKFGRGPDSVSKAYEDQIKALVNPTRPTPTGIGYALPNLLMKFGLVTFDDCERSSGTMIEVKGPTYTDILRTALERQDGKQASPPFSVLQDLLKQSENQVEGARATGQAIRWYFADEYAAAYARKEFAENDEGRENIEIVVVPALRRK